MSLAPGGEGTPQRNPAIELVEITKRFPGVLANDAISLKFYRGEVHCLLGENGAGKSTLMNILSGMYQPDEGTICVDGDAVDITSPNRGLSMGIGMVYQHVVLAPSFSVLENLMLGTSKSVTLQRETASKRLDELMELLGIELNQDAKASSLALGQKQQVDIMRALWRGSEVLILDEPTSMLTPQGVKELAAVIERLKSEGLAIIFITHKLHEALSLGDRISVLRQGRVVGALEPELINGCTPSQLHDMIIEMMFGKDPNLVPDVGELAEDVSEIHVEHRRVDPSVDPILSLAEVSVDGLEEGETGIKGVSFDLRPGEILGIAGVDGNGQRALAEAIAGQRPPASGSIRFDGVDINARSVEWRQQHGIRYVTDDATGEGVVGDFAVGLNLVAKRIGLSPFWNGRTIRFDAIQETAEQLIEDYDIRTPSSHTRVATLSGGNIRKTLLARELTSEPRVVVFNKPTYGLDVKTTAAVRARIKQQARDGVASVVISTELEELIEVADRVGVMSRGQLTGVIDLSEIGDGVEERIGQLMVGETQL